MRYFSDDLGSLILSTIHARSLSLFGVLSSPFIIAPQLIGRHKARDPLIEFVAERNVIRWRVKVLSFATFLTWRKTVHLKEVLVIALQLTFLVIISFSFDHRNPKFQCPNGDPIQVFC